jgi:hypothetical protein
MHWCNLFRGISIPSADEIEAEQEERIQEFKLEQRMQARAQSQQPKKKDLYCLKFFADDDGRPRILIDWDESRASEQVLEGLGSMINDVTHGVYVESIFNILMNHGNQFPNKQAAIKHILSAWDEASEEEADVAAVPSHLTLRKMLYESQANQQ